MIPGTTELMPPVIAGVLTGVVRAVALFFKEDPRVLRGWRWWFVTYERVPLTTAGAGFLVMFATIAFEGGWDWDGSYAVHLPDLPLMMFGILVFAIVYSMVGVLFGIPIAAIVCVLIHDVWLWIDDGD